MECCDLTHVMHGGMPRFRAYWHCDVSFEQMGRIATEGRNTTRITFGSHAGTHMDAPLHFIDGGTSIDEIPVSLLVGPAMVLDLRDVGPGEPVTAERLARETLAERTIIRLGWAEMWEKGDFYSGYPYFSDEAIEHIVSSGTVKLLGMDTPSPDDSRIACGSPQDSKAHKRLLSAGIVIMEYLDMTKVEAFGKWNLAALPLKLGGCDGSPIRAVLYR
jgi:arylformamidase